MAKTKYHFNSKSLTFEKAKVTIKDRILKFLSYIATGVAFSSLVMLIAYNFFNSPKEKKLEREIEQYEFQYKLLNDRMSKVQTVIADLEHRDDNIYRSIFEADPIPNSVRKAGFGGSERYEELKGFDNTELITETTKKLDEITSQLYVQSKSFDEVWNMARNKAQMMSAIPAIIPIKNGANNIVSGFGRRFHPILKTLHFHTGIDITAPRGTPIYAAGDGTVVDIKGMSGYGNVVVINHGFGYQTLYGHMSKKAVRPGQKVKRGECIGYVGSTGMSTAPHLHYEVIKNGTKINPINFFFKDLSPQEYQNVIESSGKVNQALS
jgi:murein DD-endopeptidase MepM/ murein hydrolase activator NlpD